MGKLDEIFTRKGSANSGGKDSLESVLQQQDDELIRSTKRLQVEKVKVGHEKEIAKDRAEMIQYENTLKSQGPSSVSPNTLGAMTKAFIDSGVDPEKANAFFQGLSEETLARMAIVSGGAKAESLMPLIFMAKQKGTTADELIRVGELFVDNAMKSQGQPMGVKDIIEIITLLDSRKGEGSLETKMLLEELKSQREQTQEILTSMHERELETTRQISDIKEGQLTNQLTEMRQEIQTLAARDFGTELEKAKTTLEKIGLKIVPPGTGGDDSLDKANKIIGTVFNTPAVGGLFNAIGDKIRASAVSAQTGGQPQAQPRQSSAGTVVCEVCMQKGVRTLLSLTPDVIAGNAAITCPTCGSVFRRPTKQ